VKKAPSSNRGEDGPLSSLRTYGETNLGEVLITTTTTLST
jgi:hypothetical protein